MSFFIDFITKLLIWLNVLIIVYNGLNIPKYYSNIYLDFLSTNAFIIFVISFFILIMAYKGGGILNYLYKFLKK
jgi:hypothetical protein